MTKRRSRRHAWPKREPAVRIDMTQANDAIAAVAIAGQALGAAVSKEFEGFIAKALSTGAQIKRDCAAALDEGVKRTERELGAAIQGDIDAQA